METRTTAVVMRCAATLAMLVAAGSAHAHGSGSSAADVSSDACIALINGQSPQAEGQAPDAETLAALRGRCTALFRRAAAVEASGSAASSSEGTEVRAAFEQAGRELVGRGDAAPLRYDVAGTGARRSLLTSNPIGWFSGLGVNATFSRALESFSKLSWIASARYARANASNGNVTTVGLGTGADFLVIGRNNAGLRIGPRLDVSFGSESFGGTTTYARAGLAGEVGYNFVASNGLALTGGVGLGGRIVGDSQNESFASFTGGEVGPYLKVGLGYGF